MNPIASDLLITVLRTEAELDLARRQAAANIPATSGPGLIGGLRAAVRFVHQFVDPRGFALAEAAKLAPQPQAAPARRATLTPIETAMPVMAREALADAA
jgi:hypothetical protein